LQVLSRGFVWLDTGTEEAMSEATEFVKAVEKRTSLKIVCPKEIALRYGWISREQLRLQISNMKGKCFEYLQQIIKL